MAQPFDSFCYPTMRDAVGAIISEKRKIERQDGDSGYIVWDQSLGVFDNVSQSKVDHLDYPLTKYPTQKEILDVVEFAKKDGLTDFIVCFNGQMDVANNAEEYEDDIYDAGVGFVLIHLYHHKEKK